MKKEVVLKEGNKNFYLLFREHSKYIIIPKNKINKSFKYTIEKILKDFKITDNSQDIVKYARCKGPEVLDIAITGKCNLNCKHCYWGDEKQKFDDIPFTKLKKIFYDAYRIGIFQIVLTGGEPLLHKDFPKIINFLSSLRFRIAIVTNGLFLNKYIDMLKRSGIYEITVSLEGFKEEHEYIRGTSWEKIVDNIRLLVKSGVRVRINTILSKKLVKHLEEFYKFCTKELKVNRVAFLPIATKGNAKFNKEIIPEQKIVHEAIMRYAGCDMPYCYPMYRKIAIGFDGFVYPCQFFREIDWFRLGNIFLSSLSKIYFLARENLVFPIIKKIYCEKCSLFKKCGGGCIGRAVAYFNNTKNPDPFWCELMKNGKTSRESLPEANCAIYSVLAKEYAKFYEKPKELYIKVEELLEKIKPTSILEVGCGDGAFIAGLKRVKNVKIVGVEKSKELSELANKRLKNRKNVKIFNMDIFEYINSKPSYFDVSIVLYSFFNHLSTEEKIFCLLQKLKEISKYVIFDVIDIKKFPKKAKIRASFGPVKLENFIYRDKRFVYDFRHYIKGKNEFWDSFTFPALTLDKWIKILRNIKFSEIKKSSVSPKRVLFFLTS